ncbi:hypothetical protein N0V93_009615 [Gnomoniopsis smithogilvyi]|uniref:Uncharacterized protein n=1 Tax=Gnomoniopsis smithogilvyi TaxID=1191159 RepID=A0A9W8YK82_9PEZI|nr:hypothetical protein N0V93_009615 [Gnomoniopsis smithogilvyi]
MPSLSTLFKKRRSQQSPPTKDQNDRGDSLRGVTRLDYGSGCETTTTSQGAELEALARLADSSDDQAIAAPTIATGPRRHSAAPRSGGGTGRLNRYVSTHDPFRRFRSRSTQFRVSGVMEGDARTRLSWPARRSTSESPDVTGAEYEQAQAQAQTQPQLPAPQRATDERPPRNIVISAREASLAALERPRAATRAGDVEEGVQEQQQRLTREDSEVRLEKAPRSHSHSYSKSSTSFGMQKLKRLPSLSLKRGFSRRMSTAI